MISPSPFITATFVVVERLNCPSGYSFYSCDSYRACCDVDPCQPEYLSADDPCYAAGGQPLDESTTTAKNTYTTTTLADFTTRDPETDTETETSTTDDLETTSSSSSAESSQSSSKGEASTTADDTTLSTSVISTPDLSSSVTGILPTPTPTNSSPSGDSSLPNGTIAGISVISAIAAIVLLTSFFWFARRRRMSKRMSSLRGTSPMPTDSPSMGFDFGFGTAEREGGDSSPASDTHAQCSELYAPGDARPGNPQHSNTTAEKQLPAEPAPTHAELDSSELPRPIPSIQRVPSTPVPDNTTTQPLPRYSSLSAAQANGHLHPPLLTPGFRGGSVQSNHDSANVPWIQPRATLNATEDERMNNQYANSWANGP